MEIAHGTPNVVLVSEKYLDRILAPAGIDCNDDQGWTDGWDNDTIAFADGQGGGPFAPLPDGTTPTCGNLFGSMHISGIQAVLCDGSVRTISYSVSPTLFANILSVNNGAVIDWNGF